MISSVNQNVSIKIIPIHPSLFIYMYIYLWNSFCCLLIFTATEGRFFRNTLSVERRQTKQRTNRMAASRLGLGTEAVMAVWWLCDWVNNHFHLPVLTFESVYCTCICPFLPTNTTMDWILVQQPRACIAFISSDQLLFWKLNVIVFQVSALCRASSFQCLKWRKR